jgi:hypothetical protein
MTIEAE